MGTASALRHVISTKHACRAAENPNLHCTAPRLHASLQAKPVRAKRTQQCAQGPAVCVPAGCNNHLNEHCSPQLTDADSSTQATGPNTRAGGQRCFHAQPAHPVLVPYVLPHRMLLHARTVQGTGATQHSRLHLFSAHCTVVPGHKGGRCSCRGRRGQPEGTVSWLWHHMPVYMSW